MCVGVSVYICQCVLACDCVIAGVKERQRVRELMREVEKDGE